jgi:UDP-N-acetylmuramoylalanine-D-glutamate ligase
LLQLPAAGLREAANIAASLAKARGDTAAPSGMLGKPRKQQHPQQAQQRQLPQQQAQQAQQPAQQAQQKATKEAAQAKAAAETQMVRKLEQLMEQLFTEGDPDLEFGAFAAMYGPAGSSWEQFALLQVRAAAAWVC